MAAQGQYFVLVFVCRCGGVWTVSGVRRMVPEAWGERSARWQRCRKRLARGESR